MLTQPISFLTHIGRLKYLLGTYYVEVPKSIVKKIDTMNIRLWCSVNDTVKFQCGLVALGEGKAYITLSKKRIKELGLDVKKDLTGTKIKVSLTEDKSEYGTQMPEELKELLNQDEEGSERFNLLGKGFQRYIINYVAGVKNPDLKIKRAVLLIGNLKKSKPGKENFRELLGLGPRGGYTT